MIVAYGDRLKDDAFKEKLSQLSIKTLSRTAKERGSGALGYAETMVMAYNRKSKYRLSMKELWGKKNGSFDFEDDEEPELE